eukprot:44519-Prorocentrum_minimum.AAC.2
MIVARTAASSAAHTVTVTVTVTVAVTVPSGYLRLRGGRLERRPHRLQLLQPRLRRAPPPPPHAGLGRQLALERVRARLTQRQLAGVVRQVLLVGELGSLALRHQPNHHLPRRLSQCAGQSNSVKQCQTVTVKQCHSAAASSNSSMSAPMSAPMERLLTAPHKSQCHIESRRQ